MNKGKQEVDLLFLSLDAQHLPFITAPGRQDTSLILPLSTPTTLKTSYSPQATTAVLRALSI